MKRRSRSLNPKTVTQPPPRVVILGAGFAGLAVAQQLAHKAFEVVLIDRHNHHTFQPLLHQVATAELEPSQVTYPIRLAFRRVDNVQFVLAEVVNVQVAQGWVETTAGRFDFDYLVMATGSQPRWTAVPGAKRHALALKTIEDAIAIHQKVIRCFERALQTPDPLEQQANLTVVIAGGGTTGVELAGAMAEWLHHSLAKDYGRLNCHQIRLVLLHSGHELLAGFRPRLQRYALRHLHQRGIEVRLQTRMQMVSATGVHLGDGGFIPAKTVIWTAGVQANLPAQIGSLSAHQRIAVGPTLQLADHPRVYALGDMAAASPPLPMLASVAVQQAHTVARNVQRQAMGQRPLPFQYRPMGAMAIISRHAAVVQMGRLTLTGFAAWLVWLAIHGALLRGWRQRFLTLLHWALSYCFRERVSQLLWQAALIENPASTAKSSS